MFKNYILTILRNLKREKLYATMNVVGLAMGIGCALVIFRIFTHEFSYDEHQSNYSEIYRVVKEESLSSGSQFSQGMPHPMSAAIRSDFPDLTAAMTSYQYAAQVGIFEEGGHISRYQEESGVVFAEPDILKIIDVEIVDGNRINPISDPNTAAISQDFARKYFKLNEGETGKAIGRRIQIDNELELTITAVIKDPPENTDFPFKLLMHYESQSVLNPYYYEGKNWHSSGSSDVCNILLPDGVSASSFEARFPDFQNKYISDKSSEKTKYKLQPLSDYHFDNRYETYSQRQVTREVLTALGIIGLFLIMTASINFINLSTAQAVKRSKEIGVRKTLGSSKSQLVLQFLSETLLIAFLAGCVSLIISELLFIHLEDVIDYKLTLDLFEDGSTFLFLLSMIVLVGLLSGSYPAWIMSNVNVVVALKKTMHSKMGAGFMSLRRVLVIIQFAISQVLIIGTIVVVTQIDYFMNKDLGFEQDAIMVIPIHNNDPQKLARFKNSLTNHPDIAAVAYGLSAPLGQGNSQSNINHPSFDESTDYLGNFKFVDEDYFEVFGLELVAGRGLMDGDSSNRIIINRKLATLLGHLDPSEAIGANLDSGWGNDLQVVGVVEDFHTRSLRVGMDYVVMINNPEIFYESGIKLRSKGKTAKDINEVKEFIEEQWAMVFPEYIFDFDFYDDQIARRYDGERKMSDMFQLFSIIAILIGCLGLYGLVSYMANQKTKEIGVRKVLGATIWNILGIFSREMVILLIVAFVIAGPVAYFAMSNWLTDYTYRIDLSPTVFVIAIAASMAIAMVTISYKSIIASLANPVTSLKDE